MEKTVRIHSDKESSRVVGTTREESRMYIKTDVNDYELQGKISSILIIKILMLSNKNKLILANDILKDVENLLNEKYNL